MPRKATLATPKKEDWRDNFIATLAVSGNVKLSCIAADVHRSTAYRERKDNPDFLASWDTALEEAADLLELEARRRATEGVAKPLVYRGKIVEVENAETHKLEPLYVREYSDTLLIFLLKGARPEKYRENTRHEVVDVTKLSDAELDAIVTGKG